MSIGQIVKSAVRNTVQQTRINQGEKSGELSNRESNKLEKRQDSISARLARDSFDGGGLSKGEAAKIDTAQDKLSKQIYGQKHDEQTKETATPVIGKRADKLQARLDAGVKSGELTEPEAAKVQAKIDGLRTAITDAKADGTVTKDERKDLRQMEKRGAVRIAINKHD